jgi:protein-disulfide isomerase-like protein with CxxC motif
MSVLEVSPELEISIKSRQSHLAHANGAFHHLAQIGATGLPNLLLESGRTLYSDVLVRLLHQLQSWRGSRLLSDGVSLLYRHHLHKK